MSLTVTRHLRRFGTVSFRRPPRRSHISLGHPLWIGRQASIAPAATLKVLGIGKDSTFPRPPIIRRPHRRRLFAENTWLTTLDSRDMHDSDFASTAQGTLPTGALNLLDQHGFNQARKALSTWAAN